MHLNTYRILFIKRLYHQVFLKFPVVCTILIWKSSPIRALSEYHLKPLNVDAERILRPSSLHHLISDHWLSPINFFRKSFWHCIERIYLPSIGFIGASLTNPVKDPRFPYAITTSGVRYNHNPKGSPPALEGSIRLQFFAPHMRYLTPAVTRMCLPLKPKRPRKG